MDSEGNQIEPKPAAPPSSSSALTEAGASAEKPPIRIAVIGVGNIGPRYAQCVHDSPSAELVALVDPDSHARSIAESMGVRYHDSVVGLLAGGAKPDAAIVCTPTHTHVAVAKTLLSAKVHVLLEKPIATTLADGTSLLRVHRSLAADRVHLLVGNHRRFNPYVWRAKEIVSSGALGEIVGVSGLWTAFKASSYFDMPSTWRKERERGGGVILTNLVHDIDLVQHLLGPITRVFAEPSAPQRDDPEHTAEEGGALTLRFRSGAVGTFLVSDATPSPFNFESGTGEDPFVPHAGQDFLRIFGSEATLSLPDMQLWSYYGQRQKDWSHALTVSKLEVLKMTPFDFQVQHLVDVIRGDSEPLSSGMDALRALAVCNAVRESMETGKPVTIRRLEGLLDGEEPGCKL
ncbi:hypothetical protein KEM52_005484 [Ascosphaera acerosa]|nr:hypothetical protein KEM52_005484 [Ascosphaera acerosa]